MAGVHVTGDRHRDDVLADHHRLRGHTGQLTACSTAGARCFRSGHLGLYLAGWTFLSGGVIDRYARQRPTRAYGFCAASGVHVFRLLRLAAVSGVVDRWLFAYVHRWLFLEWFVERTRVIGVEREVFLWRLALYLAFGLVLLSST